MTKWIFCGLLCACLATAAGAQERTAVKQSRPADAAARVELENVAGSVTVTGWDKNEVSVEGQIEPEAEFEFTGGPENLRISVQYPEGRHGSWGHKRGGTNQGSDLDIHVPAGSSIQVQAVSADVQVGGVSGAMEVEGVSGGIRITGKGSSGDNKERGLQRIEVSCVSGGVDVTAARARSKIQSVSGDIMLSLDGGELECSNVSGSTRITGQRLESAEVSCVSGDIVYDGALVKDGSYELSCHSGSLDFIVPADTSAEFSVDTISGDIESDFGGDIKKSSEFTPGKELELTVGSGGARVELSCFSGTARLRKK